MLMVYIPAGNCSSALGSCHPFIANILHVRLSVARETATYNCPCENTGLSNKMPKCCKLWPCDLLMVIAKAGNTGNCRLVMGNGKSVSDGLKEMRGNEIVVPAWSPVTTRASMHRVCKRVMIMRVPFAKPLDIFLKRSTGAPTFRRNSCGGMPES